MPVVELRTKINSSIEICFDLSRSIDFHKISTAHTSEKAVAGITTGLIKFNESVTWQAKHFGVIQKLTSKITAFDRPNHFRDEQQKGPFKFIIHDHYFMFDNGTVLMKDVFKFQSPFGFIGKLTDKFLMTAYLKKLLV